MRFLVIYMLNSRREIKMVVKIVFMILMSSVMVKFLIGLVLYWSRMRLVMLVVMFVFIIVENALL